MKIETIRQLFRNFLSLGTSKIVTGFLYFLLTIYFARVLGVENFGKYEFSIAFYVIFSLISAFGLNKIGTRDIARINAGNPEMVKDYTNNLISLRFAGSVISFIALAIVASIIPKPLDIKLLIILNGIAILFSFMSLEWFFIGIERMKFVAYSRILKALAFLTFSVIFIRSSSSVLLVPAVRNAAVFFAIFLLVIIYVKKWGTLKFSFDYDKWKILIIKAYPILVAGIMTKIYLKFDAIMIGFLMGEKDVGLYVAVYRIVLFLIGMRALGIASIFPALSRFAVESKEKLNELVYLSEKLLIMIAIPIGVGGVILAFKIVPLIFGPAYMKGVAAFQVLIWAFVIMGINFVFPQLQIAMNNQKKYMYISIVGVLTNIVLNFVLIPIMGIAGAAIATVLAEVITFIFFYWNAKKIIEIHLIRLILKPLLASIIFAIPVFIFKDINLCITISFGVISYFALLLVFGYIKKGEFLTLVKVLKIK